MKQMVNLFFQRKLLIPLALTGGVPSFWTADKDFKEDWSLTGPTVLLFYCMICKSQKYTAPPNPTSKFGAWTYLQFLVKRLVTTLSGKTTRCYIRRLILKAAILWSKVSTHISSVASGCILLRPFCAGNMELKSLGKDWLRNPIPPQPT